MGSSWKSQNVKWIAWSLMFLARHHKKELTSLPSADGIETSDIRNLKGLEKPSASVPFYTKKGLILFSFWGVGGWGGSPARPLSHGKPNKGIHPCSDNLGVSIPSTVFFSVGLKVASTKEAGSCDDESILWEFGLEKCLIVIPNRWN